MMLLLQTLLSLLEILECWLWELYFFKTEPFSRKQKIQAVLTIGIAWGALAYNRSHGWYSYSVMWIIILIMLFGSCRVFQIFKRECFVLVSAFYIVLYFLYLVAVCIMGEILQKERMFFYIHTEPKWERLFIYGIVDFLLFIVFLLVSHRKRKGSRTAIRDSYPLLKGGIIFGFAAIWYFLSHIDDDIGQTVISDIGLMILVMIGIFGYFMYINHHLQARHRRTLIQSKNEMLEKNYRDFERIYNSSSYRFHDFKNHMKVLENLVESGRNEEALTYIRTISDPVRELEKWVWTGNEIIDLIVNTKRSEAAEKGITMELDMERLPAVSIAEADLCAIFANLLDNAIEACQYKKDKEAWIKIRVKNRKDLLMIQVDNTTFRKSRMEAGRYITSKEDRENHGFGIQNLQMIVAQYGGTISFEEREGIFKASIMFFGIYKEERQRGKKYGKQTERNEKELCGRGRLPDGAGGTEKGNELWKRGRTQGNLY